jgi:hypothetical protein
MNVPVVNLLNEQGRKYGAEFVSLLVDLQRDANRRFIGVVRACLQKLQGFRSNLNYPLHSYAQPHRGGSAWKGERLWRTKLYGLGELYKEAEMLKNTVSSLKQDNSSSLAYVRRCSQMIFNGIKTELGDEMNRWMVFFPSDFKLSMATEASPDAATDCASTWIFYLNFKVWKWRDEAERFLTTCDEVAKPSGEAISISSELPEFKDGFMPIMEILSKAARKLFVNKKDDIDSNIASGRVTEGSLDNPIMPETILDLRAEPPEEFDHVKTYSGLKEWVLSRENEVKKLFAATLPGHQLNLTQSPIEVKVLFIDMCLDFLEGIIASQSYSAVARSDALEALEGILAGTEQQVTTSMFYAVASAGLSSFPTLFFDEPDSVIRSRVP